jgi:isoleucyl-tRNA synthetase
MSAPSPHEYPEVAAQPDYVALEEAVLELWERERTFEESVARRAGAPDFVFYDGPPFANGLPHYGHLLTGFVKDAIPRYRTMRGKRVERRFGWDCHGLPAEMEAERALGVSGRGPITEFGVDRFNDYCREAVLRYTREWRRYVTRQGRWVDFDNDYKTMDLSYMESVLWAFKRLHERGLVYEDYRVLPYCWECETPLSNAETRLDDAYRDRVDPAVTVLMDLLPLDEADRVAGGGGEGGGDPALSGPLRLLAWTTTPWTLPSNLAVAVGPDLEYAVLERDGERLVIGVERLDAYADELAGAVRVATVRGEALVGRRYRPLFPYFAGTPNAFQVLSADFVETGEGTGIVQMAPGFGEDDQRVCTAAGIEVIVPVDERGRFDPRVPDFAGLVVFEANPLVIEALSRQGAVLRAEEYTHSYPHCWRTDTPLIYRAMTSFFVAVTAVKEQMLALNHEQVRFIPEHVRDGAFGKWLEGARDWSISRNRFWGSPIPVWRSDDPAYPREDVYGSLDELERDFGVRPTDLHRPAVDELTRPNPDDPTGRSTMRRVTDVLDCWFDSGSMSYAQVHYPFEHGAWFEENFPADFICEYVGQTRAWFYTLHVLATALFGRPAFRTCVAHGVVLGDDGRKLSKRLKNFPDPDEVFASLGADALRWYFFASPVLRGNDVIVEREAMSAPVREVMNPIWNTWYFLALYGRADHLRGTIRTSQTGLLDRWLLARTRALVEEVTSCLDGDDLPGATAAVSSYLEALTNWYVRRSRERFWRPAEREAAATVTPATAVGGERLRGERVGQGGGEDDKRDAYDTLHTALEVLTRVCAPLLPFLTETVWRGLTGGKSVHLEDWPVPDEIGLPAEPELVADMELVREVASAAHSIRKANGLRARLPLRSLTIAAPAADRLGGFAELLAEELNVKQVQLREDVGELASTKLSVRPAALGPRLGDRTQQVIAAARRGEFEVSGEAIVVAGERLLEGEFELRLVPLDDQATRVLRDGAAAVSLDVTLDDRLEGEGLTRDLVREIQLTRREAGLHVTDRIELALVLSGRLAKRLDAWTDGAGAADCEEGGGKGTGEELHVPPQAAPPWLREVMTQTLAVTAEVRVVESGAGDAGAHARRLAGEGWHVHGGSGPGELGVEIDNETVLVAVRRQAVQPPSGSSR